GRRMWAAAALVAAAAVSLLLALGFSGTAVVGAGLIVAGFAVVLTRGGSIRRGGSLPVLAIALMMAGAITVLGHIGTSRSFLGPGAVAGARPPVLWGRVLRPPPARVGGGRPVAAAEGARWS